MVKITREKTDAGPWLSAVESTGGGSLPSWWTVDSTPGSESVEMDGRVTIVRPPGEPTEFALTLVQDAEEYDEPTHETAGGGARLITPDGRRLMRLRWFEVDGTDEPYPQLELFSFDGADDVASAEYDANYVGLFSYTAGDVGQSYAALGASEVGASLYLYGKPSFGEMAGFYGDYAGSEWLWGLKKEGHESLGALSAAADGAVNTDEHVQWFDSTTGDATVRWKHKDAAGTLTAGRVLSIISTQSHIADPSGGGTVDSQARTAINAILDVLELMKAVAP